MLVASGFARLHELDTVYGIKDAYDLIEIIEVDAHNRRVLARKDP